MTDADLASLDRAGFVATFGAVFEHSPWIAEQAWQRAPFHSIAAVHAAMVAVLDAADAAVAIALVRAHPELAGQAARDGDLTAESRSEQTASGLSHLSVEEHARVQRLNAAYRAKFGFPFVMAVRRSDKHAILAAFAARLDNEPDVELDRALGEIKIIARLRLEAIAPGDA